MIYFKEGTVVDRVGSSVVYKYGQDYYLETGPGHNLISSTGLSAVYRDQLRTGAIRGTCLEIGLGLGVASYCILNEGPGSLTTIEPNRDIYALYERIKDRLDVNQEVPHVILTADPIVYAGLSSRKFDYIYLNCYTVIDEDTLPHIEELAVALKPLLNEGGSMWGWYDEYAEPQHLDIFRKVLL